MNKDSKTVKTDTATKDAPRQSENDFALDENGVAFDDGQWCASTLGHLVSLLIDAGTDDAVLFRVLGDGPSLESGAFARRWEIVVVPNGLVLAMMRQYGVEHAHKVLSAYLRNRLIT